EVAQRFIELTDSSPDQTYLIPPIGGFPYRNSPQLRRVVVATTRIVLTTLTLPQRTWSSTNHLRIGRLPDLEVMLDDGSISRRHAEVVLAEEGWVLRDFGSMNGTQLNGVRVGRTPQRVRQGDTISVGNIDLRIEVLQGQPSTIQIGGQRSVQVEATS